ncbi:sensor histidine kinase [Roseovarius nanhaiticus]|uniref:sensor histidine kinase n=1 Tax=Roseovarius nanhaiticus TaxID=573024 RepID=UPI002490A4D5|nr:HAMP domain-containing sensor histidine kinase [Roseovarius nanhaiticus]
MRLSLQFAFLYAVLSAVMFFGAYWMTEYEVRDWIEDQMRSDLVAFERVYAARGEDGLMDRIATLSEFSFENERIYQLRGPDGEHLAGTVIDVDAIGAGAHVFLPVATISAGSPPSAEVSGYWTRIDRIGPYNLVQGTGDHVIAEVLEALSIALVAGYILVISAGLIIGQFVGIRTERRIGSIMETLEDVARGGLARRIPASEGDRDDLSRVSGAVNVMLEQLETLLESQRQIATDIAHDLRTPLQRLRQRLERMQATHQDDPDLAAALGETETLIETFRALLRIAQIEAGTQQSYFVTLDLGDLARNLIEIYQPVAEDEGQSLIARLPDGPVMMQGDPALLGQLISNVIENAVRHCPMGATLVLSLDADTVPVLCMSDDGPGIPEDERDKVFRRFYRVEKSRTTEGHGLGLPLVKAICTLHDAHISLADNSPGLIVTVTFPQSVT